MCSPANRRAASRHPRSATASRPTTRASCDAGRSTRAGSRRPASCCSASRRSGERYRGPITFGALLGGIPVSRLSCSSASSSDVAPGAADRLRRRFSRRDLRMDGQGVDRGRRWPARGSRPSCRRRAARLVGGLVHPDDVERCREIYRRALERREPFQMEVPRPRGRRRGAMDPRHGESRGSPERTSTVTSGRPSTSPGLDGRARSCQI